MPDSFYTASEARTLSTGRREIYDEIKLIEGRIMTAVDAGDALEVLVGPGSDVPVNVGMTVSTVHYNAWYDSLNQNTDAARVATKQMGEVMGHFVRLGYNITRERQGETSTFNWKIKW